MATTISYTYSRDSLGETATDADESAYTDAVVAALHAAYPACEVEVDCVAISGASRARVAGPSGPDESDVHELAQAVYEAGGFWGEAQS